MMACLSYPEKGTTMGMVFFTSPSENSLFVAALTNVSRICDEKAETENSSFQTQKPRHIRAIAHIRRMRGGSQAQLFRASDQNYYVVKFPDNPQGAKTLACDFLGTLLAIRLGLPAQPPQLIEVPPALIENSEDLSVKLESGTVPFRPGTCLSSLYPSQRTGAPVPLVGQVIDFGDGGNTASIRNVTDCAGIFVFDQWTCNTDTRQLLLWRTFRDRLWQISMIDQGRCFNGTHWNFPDSPLWGFHNGLEPYLTKKSFRVFESWLHRLEREIDESALRTEASKVPPEWYGNDKATLDQLLERLDQRRTRTRDLIWNAMDAVSSGLMRFYPGLGRRRAFEADAGTKLMKQPNPKAECSKAQDKHALKRPLARSKTVST
jgi:HipA-like kinase